MQPVRTETSDFEIASIESIAQIQFGHRQFPQAYVLPCGDWLVTFCWTDDAYFAKTGFLRSSDRGRTWREEGCAIDSGVIVPLGGQAVGFFDSFYAVPTGGADQFAVRACFSGDGGRSWGPVEHNVPIHCPGAEVFTLAEMMQSYFTLPCFPWNRFFQAHGFPPIAPGWPETARKIRFGGAGPSPHTVWLDDGRLVSMNYCRGRSPVAGAASYWFAFALESTDKGRSWRQIGIVPWTADWEGEGALFGSVGFTESALAWLAGCEVLIVLRAGSYQPMATSRSADGGRTWSRPEPILLENAKGPARGVAPVMVRMTNGCLACVYGRPGIHLMTDPTGTGRHWRHEVDLRALERELCRQRGAASCEFESTENVGIVAVAPGELAVTYDLWGWTEAADKPSVRQTIRLARLRAV